MIHEGAKKSAKVPSATIPTLAVQNLSIAEAYIESEDRSEKILRKVDLRDAGSNSDCDIVLTGISNLDPDLDSHQGHVPTRTIFRRSIVIVKPRIDAGATRDG
jgi:hypothetical protein